MCAMRQQTQVGAECPVCLGFGEETTEHTERVCRRCNGTGYAYRRIVHQPDDGDYSDGLGWRESDGGTHWAVPVGTLTIEKDESGQWPEWVYAQTFAVWHGAGWQDQATPTALMEARAAVTSWLDGLGGGE